MLIGSQEAARIGDKTEHGGVIVEGCPTVLIGSDRVVDCFKTAAASGTPFVTQAGDE